MQVIFSGKTLVVRQVTPTTGCYSWRRPRPRRPSGIEEYEYFIRVKPTDFPVLSVALGGRASDDMLSLVVERGSGIVRTGEASRLASHGIPFVLENWGH